MNCTISLIDTTKNKVIKSETLSSNYKEAESEVSKRNEKSINKQKYWKVTSINN